MIWIRREPRKAAPRMRAFGWMLQFAALIIVGSALLVGLFYGALRTEIALLAVGSLVFLLGRRLNRA